jgi:hypothetical protein
MYVYELECMPIVSQQQCTLFPIYSGPRSPNKRSRMSIDDEIFCEDRSKYSTSMYDPCTIDINQYDEQQSSSLSLVKAKNYSNHSHALVTAVKMVQPIVDIIFNAFEQQLKTTDTPSIFPISNNLVPYSVYSPSNISTGASTTIVRPIALHTVHFNIQLTTEQQQQQQQQQQQLSSSICNTLIQCNDHSRSFDINELEHGILPTLASNEWSNMMIADNDQTHMKRQRLKQMFQYALVGMSVLCGYWLL